MPSKISVVLLVLFCLFAESGTSGTDVEPFSVLLRQQAGASNRDLERYVGSDRVFVKVLPHIRPGEVAVVGALRIPVTMAFFLERFRDIQTFKKGPAVLGIGKFSDPPLEQNLQELTLGDKTLDALAVCRPGKCGVKLSAEMMDRLRKAAVSSGRGAKLEREFREVLLDYLSCYLERGTPAMITYSDTDPPVHSSGEFLELLQQFIWLQDYAPPLFEALKDSLPKKHSEVEELIYWSREGFGLKPVASMTQVLILKTAIEGKRWAFLASKQIYADHYFEASLGLTVLAEQSGDPRNPLLSVAYFNRSSTDGLRGWFASITRALVERRVRSGLAKNLKAMKGKLKQLYYDSVR